MKAFRHFIWTVSCAAVAAAAENPGMAAQVVPSSFQTYVYKTVGDLAIHADVYIPEGDELRPAILWIHGGALILGGRQDLRRDQRERYLSAGYVIVSIDYRLAPETKLPGIIDDVRDAFQWMRTEGSARFNIDPDRIGVVGHSAGGYLALLAGHHLRPRPQAIVSFYGYGDITGGWYSQPDPFYLKQPLIAKEDAYRAISDTPVSENPPPGRGRYYRYCRQQGIWPQEVTGHDPERQPLVFEPWCPIRNITSDYPPTMLFHGGQDNDVPIEQSELMAAELMRQGVEHEFISRNEWVHGFDGVPPGMRDPDVAAAFDRVIAFIDRHTQ